MISYARIYSRRQLCMYAFEDVKLASLSDFNIFLCRLVLLKRTHACKAIAQENRAVIVTLKSAPSYWLHLGNAYYPVIYSIQQLQGRATS